LSYTVTTTDGTAARQTYPITTQIDGWENMSYECSSQIYRTIEYEINGKYDIVADTREEIRDNALPFIYITADNEISFGLTQKEFERKAQFMFETSNASITAPAKIVYKDSTGEELTGLTQSFDFVMANNGAASKCANAQLTLESSAYDTYLAFSGEWDMRDLEVYKALEAKSDTQGCDPIYKLYGFSPYPSPNDGWMPFDRLVDVIESQGDLTSGRLQTWVSFDQDNSDFISTFSRTDVQDLTARFTDNGETALKLKVKAAIAGSDSAGPHLLAGASLPEAEFKIVMLSDATVADCAKNKLTVRGSTVATSAARPAMYTYQIADKDAAGTSLNLEANAVEASIAGCTIETVFQWLDTTTGEWKDLRSNTWMETDFAADKMLVKFEGANLQEKYLSEWVDMFREATTVGTPDKIEVQLRFAHRDASHNRWDPTTQTKYDEFRIEILSSKEDPTVYCDELAALTLESGTDASGASFDYAIASGDVAQATFPFRVTIDEAKYAALKPICRDVLYYTLDFQKGDTKWTTQYSTKWDDAEKASRVMKAKLDMADGEIVVAMSQDQFMNDIQRDLGSML
jgi:hypothetical protein